LIRTDICRETTQNFTGSENTGGLGKAGEKIYVDIDCRVEAQAIN
jgi:hypothetical protein